MAEMKRFHALLVDSSPSPALFQRGYVYSMRRATDTLSSEHLDPSVWYADFQFTCQRVFAQTFLPSFESIGPRAFIWATSSAGDAPSWKILQGSSLAVGLEAVTGPAGCNWWCHGHCRQAPWSG